MVNPLSLMGKSIINIEVKTTHHLRFNKTSGAEVPVIFPDPSAAKTIYMELPSCGMP